MEVSGSSEVGISPVLLQAINQLQKSKQAQVTLTGSHISNSETLQAVSGLPLSQQVMIAGGDSNTPKIIKVEGKPPPPSSIIQRIEDTQSNIVTTAVKPIQPRIIQTANGQRVLIVQTAPAGGESPSVLSFGGPNSLVQTVVQPEPKKVIVKSISGNVVNIGGSKMVLSRQGSMQTSVVPAVRLSEGDHEVHKSASADLQMGNVLSAIASHVKNQRTIVKPANIVTDPQVLSPQRVFMAQRSTSTTPSTTDNVLTQVSVHSSPQVPQVQSPPIKRIKLSPQSDPTTLEVIHSGHSDVSTPLTVVKSMASHIDTAALQIDNYPSPLTVVKTLPNKVETVSHMVDHPSPLTVVKTIPSNMETVSRVIDYPSPLSVVKTLPNKVETVSRVIDYPSPLTVVTSVSNNVEPTSRVVDYPVQLEDGTQVILQQIEPIETTVETAGESSEEQPMSHFSFMMQESTSTSEASGPPCPICGDRISGYHYGIFTCESCKGFFKRTVQNKKAFICHRKGECDINIVNRKKCPACRFKRCLVSGMKLEAVRVDRQRGGRSSYEGAIQYAGKPKTPSMHTPKRLIVRTSHPPVRRTIVLPTSSGTQAAAVIYKDDDGTGMVQTPGLPVQPYTPQVLEDLLAVEALMAENEEEQECCIGKFQEGDDNMFSSLLHFADHCLYKIVRWARNLPDFANVSTDDQILLLQNSWGELLCMCCCWNSIHHEDMLKLAHGRMLDIPKAQEMDILEVTQKLIDFTAHLRSLELDLHEYVALKVMLLLNPDVKNLQDSVQIRSHQEMVCEYLMLYTATHDTSKPNKFCELLARLPELSRSCIQAKEILKQRQGLGDIPQYSLLSELLKGDAVVQSS